MVDIQSLFESLQPSKFAGEQNRFVAIAIPEYPYFHLAKDSDQLPSLLISVTDTSAKPAPPITLEHLSIVFDAPCRISRSDGASDEGIFTVIRCIGRERLLHTYFLRAIRVLFDLLPTTPTKAEVGQAISTLVELFRSITSSPKKSIQGLWAELFLIDTALRPEILVAAWHTTPHDRFDFNAGNERIEVKSTSQRIRQHHFALDQLVPIEGTRIVIASLFTEPVSRGITVIELADKIRDKLRAFPVLAEHLDRIVTTTLGNNWRAAFDEAFDRQLALTTLQFYDAATLPSIPIPLPIGISDVHFRADLSICPSLDLTRSSKTRPLLSTLRRR
jgi:hypothetical protein